MKIVYHIIHLEHMNERNDAVLYNQKMLERAKIKNIDCQSIDLSTFQQMDEFIADHEGFDVVRHNKFQNPFPHVSGVVGCWASHWISWVEFLKTDAEVLVVLEDDVLLKKIFIDSLPKLIENLPNNWGTMSFCIPENEENRYSVFIHDIGNPLVCIGYQEWSTGGYIISKSGAQKLIDYVAENGIDQPIDWFLLSSAKEIFGVYNPVPYLPKMTVFHDDYQNSYIGKTEGVL